MLLLFELTTWCKVCDVTWLRVLLVAAIPLLAIVKGEFLIELLLGVDAATVAEEVFSFIAFQAQVFGFHDFFHCWRSICWGLQLCSEIKKEVKASNLNKQICIFHANIIALRDIVLR